MSRGVAGRFPPTAPGGRLRAVSTPLGVSTTVFVPFFLFGGVVPLVRVLRVEGSGSFSFYNYAPLCLFSALLRQILRDVNVDRSDRPDIL